jgi:DNA (cytosine-5)-methyltransferase 1
LRPFQKKDGGLAHAWLDIAEAFYTIGYVPICTHSSALYYGVPQSRHRFIMICLRKDVAELCDRMLRKRPKWKPVLELIMNAHDHLQCDSEDTPTKSKKDAFRWVDATSQPELWPKSLLVQHKEGPNVVKAINDLPRLGDRHGKISLSEYARRLAIHLPVPAVSGRPKGIDGAIANHEFRTHCIRVRARFHVLRLLANKLGTALGSDDLQRLTIEQKNSLLKHMLLFLDAESLRRPKDLAELDALLLSLVSQKHSQKALRKDRHAPAQLTIPDDLVHYAEDRTLTVREMARFQSFPDDFEFTGKVTTGGRLRSYEVPQYTQVGNAVPPLLARAVGKGLVALFKALED